MASIVDAFNEALSENMAIAKISLYAIPVYIVLHLFIVGRMSEFYCFAIIVGVTLLGLLTQGINNVRTNQREILTFNLLKLVKAIGYSFIVVVPQLLIFGTIGSLIVKNVSIPIELPHVPLIFQIIVWSIIFAIVLTSYLSFAKYLKILQGFNYATIFESCMDVFIGFLFFIPQLLLANVVLIGPIAYLFSYFKVPFTHWGFIADCSAVIIINVSILSNYMAQTAYEHIKGSNEEYDENVQINLIDESAERLNGR